jgi:hypothetical protein
LKQVALPGRVDFEYRQCRHKFIFLIDHGSVGKKRVVDLPNPAMILVGMSEKYLYRAFVQMSPLIVTTSTS